ncbi:MAG: hypothetical protein N3A72_10040 [bacterium]|nr:hypothetical protein [bacterium]
MVCLIQPVCFAVESEPINLRTLNPNFDFFPESSLYDFSVLLDAPAGKHGFLSVRPDGHFYFADGTRARFWGVVIPQEHVDIPKERIDRVVETLARAGVNLVRFDSLDRPGGIIRRNIFDESYPRNAETRYFDRNYRDRLAYWIYKLKQRGIYTYLTLRAERVFKPGDSVVNADQLGAGARPYAYFNQKLIELQNQYAEKFLCSYINPYTGLSFAADPAVAMLELVAEDSFFTRPERLNMLVEPYKTELQQKWNQWLLKKYGTTANLNRAWTVATRRQFALSGLTKQENLEQQTVLIPNMTLDHFESVIKGETTDPMKSPGRRADAVRFLVELQRQYFAELRDFLREKGLKIPLTASVNCAVIPDTWSVIQELDFTVTNMVVDNPEEQKMPVGKLIAYLPQETLAEFGYENKNELKSTDEWSLMPWVTRAKWAGKPLVLRKTATCWPNHYRAGSMVETAVYCGLQDIDAVLFSAYHTTDDIATLTSYGMQSDPTRWGLFGLGAKLFLAREIRPTQRMIDIGYSLEDMCTYANYLNELHVLAWFYRIQNRFIDREYDGKADLVIASGRSHAAKYPGSKSIIYANTEFANAAQNKFVGNEETIYALSKYRVSRVPISPMEFSFAGIGFESVQATKLDTQTAFTTENAILLGYQPMGIDITRKYAYGFYDPKRENLLIAEAKYRDIPKFAVDLMARWYHLPITHHTLTSGIFPSETGEIIRDTNAGILYVDTENTQVIAGAFNSNQPYTTTKMEIVSQSPFAVIIATSLDTQPITVSKRILVKMVTVAENTGQKLSSIPHVVKEGKFYPLLSAGRSPIVTLGQPIETPTKIRLNGKQLVEVCMQNGTWELLCDLAQDRYYLYCDTPNIQFTINSRSDRLRLIRFHDAVEPDDPQKVDRTFIYPGFAKYIELTGMK